VACLAQMELTGRLIMSSPGGHLAGDCRLAATKGDYSREMRLQRGATPHGSEGDDVAGQRWSMGTHFWPVGPV